MALVNDGVEYSLICGNSPKFSGSLSATNGYGRQMVVGRKFLLTLEIGHSTPLRI